MRWSCSTALQACRTPCTHTEKQQTNSCESTRAPHWTCMHTPRRRRRGSGEQNPYHEAAYRLLAVAIRQVADVFDVSSGHTHTTLARSMRGCWLVMPWRGRGRAITTVLFTEFQRRLFFKTGPFPIFSQLPPQQPGGLSELGSTGLCIPLTSNGRRHEASTGGGGRA